MKTNGINNNSSIINDAVNPNVSVKPNVNVIPETKEEIAKNVVNELNKPPFAFANYLYKENGKTKVGTATVW